MRTLISSKRICTTSWRNDRAEANICRFLLGHATVENSYETVDSIQDTVESSQSNEIFTQCRNYEIGLDLKVELEHLKLEQPYNKLTKQQ